MPVAFLEPQLNEYNACSVYTTKSPRERASELCGLGQLSGSQSRREFSWVEVLHALAML